MPPSKRMVQEVAELSDEIVRLRAELIETRQWRDAETEIRQKRDAEIAALTEQRDRAMTMLRKVERVLYYDTAAPDEPHCGWGPLWVEVRAVLDTPSSPSLPQPETEGP